MQNHGGKGRTFEFNVHDRNGQQGASRLGPWERCHQEFVTAQFAAVIGYLVAFQREGDCV